MVVNELSRDNMGLSHLKKKFSPCNNRLHVSDSKGYQQRMVSKG